MIEYDRTKQNNLADKAEMKICVAGVGGAGSNVLDRITLDRSVDAELICFHTDVRVLSHGMSPVKVQLGGDLMKGVGAGGDPDLGREAALFSKEQIRQSLLGREIVFICTGLGGGTGSGAAPVVAEIAKSSGALVIVLATMPFSFEGRRRLNQAEEALELLQKRADALILFDNNRMGELVLPKEGIQRAFTLADQTLAQCVRAVTVMVSTPGLVKLGLDDLVAALNASNGRCLFGFGEGKGQNRGTDALKKALKSPLIDSGRLLQETKNLLAHIVGGDSLTLAEVDGIMKQLGRSVPEETQILFGLAVDPKLGDAISVTLISSLGLEQLAVKPVMAEEIAVVPKPMIAERKRMAVTPPVPPAPAPAVEPPPMELFSEAAPEPADDEMFTEEAAEEPEAEAQPEVPAAVESKEVVEEAAEEIEETPIVAAAPPVREPEPQPVASSNVIRSRRNERQPAARPRGVLASVLSSPSAVASHVAAADKALAEEDADDLLFSSAATARQPALASSATTAPGEQQTFRLGDEDRGRFKDTEPSISDGEDLDVPTWMRLRKKVRH